VQAQILMIRNCVKELSGRWPLGGNNLGELHLLRQFV
jgi:hypothetical protein